MCLGAIGGHAKLLSGENIGSSFASSDGSRSRREQAGLAAMGAPRAEVHNLAALRSGNHPSSFAGNHRLVAQRGEQIGLHDLAFDDGRDNAQHGLARKNQRTFGHGPDIAGKTKRRQVIVKFVADVPENRMVPQVIDFLGAETHVLQKFQALFESRGN